MVGDFRAIIHGCLSSLFILTREPMTNFPQQVIETTMSAQSPTAPSGRSSPIPAPFRTDPPAGYRNAHQHRFMRGCERLYGTEMMLDG